MLPSGVNQEDISCLTAPFGESTEVEEEEPNQSASKTEPCF